MINVYIKHDDRRRVIDINSDIFIADPAGWVKIDEGEGDRYAHAQSHYLPESLYNADGVPTWKLESGAVMHRTQAEIEADVRLKPKPAPDPTAARIATLEGELLTSYVAQAELYEKTMELEAQVVAQEEEMLTVMMAVADIYEMQIGG